MNCKNCEADLLQGNKFCPECGAKVVLDRITLKSLFSDVLTKGFGWDNKYWITLRDLILCPEIPFRRYIDGTRKRYVNPFAFLGIGAAIAALAFNQSSGTFIEFAEILNQWQIGNGEAAQTEKEWKLFLDFYTLLTFLTLPVNTLLLYWVFGKPYNLGEHLVINGYVQGLLSLALAVLLVISSVTHPLLYLSSPLIGPAYYFYAYGRLYGLSALKIAKKFFKYLLLYSIMGAVITSAIELVKILFGLG